MMLRLLKKMKGRVFDRIRHTQLVMKAKKISHFLEFVSITEGYEDLLGSQVLVLAPHPDDESIACGGLIKLLTSRGENVDVCFVTRGEKGIREDLVLTAELAKKMQIQRADESEQACRLLGIRGRFYLNGRDGETFLQSDLWLELKERLVQGNYDAIFCPWPYDTHSDHVTTFRLLARTLKDYSRPVRIWLYELWNPLLANRIVPIDDTIATKLEAIRAYRSQTDCLDYPAKLLALSQYRSLLSKSARHAEAYLTCSREVVLSLAGQQIIPSPSTAKVS